MQENKLGVMPIRKLIWNMSLPIIASMLVQALYNVVDSMFVAMVSQDALTAVSLAFSAQQLMIGLGTGTAVGVNALMGRALGARQQDRADKVAINGVFLAFVGFVISAVLGLAFSNTLFSFQTDQQHIIDMGNSYLKIIAGCSFALFGQIMFERLLQGTGRSIYSMITQGTGAIINIILDPVFIFVFKMGVAGAAIATIIGQCCGCALAIYFNLKKNTDIRLRFGSFRPDWRIIGGIYAIGIPGTVLVKGNSMYVQCEPGQVEVLSLRPAGKKQMPAADYLRAGSFKPGRQQDLFLYHTVTMTARPKNNDNDNGGHHGGFGSGGGFSSTHVSSSGTTHGGSSGSF